VQPDSPTARRNLSRAGLNVIRVVVLVLLIPIGFLAHVGLGLYVVFAIGSNIILVKNPSLVLRLERWGAPIALFFAKHRRHHVSPHADGAIEDAFALGSEFDDRPWSAVKQRPEGGRRPVFRRRDSR
jgi:hypothetical protein